MDKPHNKTDRASRRWHSTQRWKQCALAAVLCAEFGLPSVAHARLSVGVGVVDRIAALQGVFESGHVLVASCIRIVKAADEAAFGRSDRMGIVAINSASDLRAGIGGKGDLRTERGPTFLPLTTNLWKLILTKQFKSVERAYNSDMNTLRGLSPDICIVNNKSDIDQFPRKIEVANGCNPSDFQPRLVTNDSSIGLPPGFIKRATGGTKSKHGYYNSYQIVTAGFPPVFLLVFPVLLFVSMPALIYDLYVKGLSYKAYGVALAGMVIGALGTGFWLTQLFK